MDKLNDIEDESDFILDNYEHKEPGLFYTVTRIFGGPDIGGPEVEYFESGCECGESGCTEESECACLRYGVNYRRSEEGGHLVLDDSKFKDSPVFECNLRCTCLPSLERLRNRKGSFCRNRYVQLGPRDSLVVFDAGEKGLGLKTDKGIGRGSFICEYAGEVIGLEEAKKRQENQVRRGEPNYVFVLKEHGGNVLRSVTCVDPSRIGNVGRYINHSCNPNAAIVAVRVNDSVPWLCVFALRDIEPGEEICFDYSGGNGSRESIPENRKRCRCGAKECRQFLPFADV